MPSLQPPLHLMTASDEIGQIIRHWTRRSLGPRVLETRLPSGTLLLRTGGSWDCVVAAAVHSDGILHPVIVFKNPVALWQCSREPLPDGRLDRDTWTWLRRQAMIHNPGLDGLLQEMENRAMPDERAAWVTTTHDWMQDVDTAHLTDARGRRQELGADDSVHLVLEVLAYADDEAQSRGERGRAEVTVGQGWVSVRDDGRGTDTRVDENGATIRKPVMATRDVRFFDADPPVLLPDGLPRRGMSVVAAVTESLTHVNHRQNGAWAQTYRRGVPEADLVPVEPDGTTGTTVRFTLDSALDVDELLERASGFGHLDVRVHDSTTADRAGPAG